jgi:hypothetical protein
MTKAEGSKPARQQGSEAARQKAARQQSSKAAKQQGSKAARQRGRRLNRGIRNPHRQLLGQCPKYDASSAPLGRVCFMFIFPTGCARPACRRASLHPWLHSGAPSERWGRLRGGAGGDGALAQRSRRAGEQLSRGVRHPTLRWAGRLTTLAGKPPVAHGERDPLGAPDGAGDQVSGGNRRR